MPARVKRRSSRRNPGVLVASPLDDGEFEAFYRRVFLPLVRRVTWKHRLLHEDARDIVQDAFVLALTRLQTNGNPRAWLIQVVDHLSINHRRKSIRRANLASRWGLGDAFEDSERNEVADRYDQ
jgi:DNA-directed RNA polymerase specialized sigma24 family protein